MKRNVPAAAIAGLLLVSAHASAREGAADEAVELDRLVVRGESGEQALSPTLVSVEVLEGEALVHRRQGTLGETLAGLPGVHLDNFGAGAARPVIRGQTLPRIEILSDGASLFDAASVSPDHAITADPLLLDGIEVYRGPAAILYGGNALGGAVNLLDSRIPKALPPNGLTGAAEVRYGTGDRGRTGVGRVTGGIGPIAVHAEGSKHDAGDYEVPGGYGGDRLRDSFAEGSSFSLGASWIASKGYIGIAHTLQEAEYGLPGHSHANGVCHNHGADLHCEAHGGHPIPSRATTTTTPPGSGCAANVPTCAPTTTIRCPGSRTCACACRAPTIGTTRSTARSRRRATATRRTMRASR